MRSLIKFCYILTVVFLAGCASPYIGKKRQEIVGIITEKYNNSPGTIYIHVPSGSNYLFDHPRDILNANRGWGPDMRKFDRWGILPYKKFLYDGTFYTLLTFKDDVVVKAEEIYGGGYGFKPLMFVFLLFTWPFVL